jgi:glycosyltransferase involved in cell wall biosynthesis
MTENELISLREGLRNPRNYVGRLVRQPGRYVRSFLLHPYKTLFGFSKSAVRSAPVAQDRDMIAVTQAEPESEIQSALPVDTETIAETGVKPAWPDLSRWPWLSLGEIVPAKMPSGKPWPKISIVTPSYQQGEYIEQTIRSVLMQGYPNLEYLVVDGGSTDYTQTVLRRYSSELDACISEADEGQADAINKGFRHSTGEILAWLNSDDMHLPTTLIEVALAFEMAEALNPTYPVDLVCGRALLYSENARAVVHEHRSKFTRGISKLPLEMNDFDLWEKSAAFFYQPEVFFTRRAWNKIGGSLNPFLHYALDYDLWIRMAKRETYLYSTDACLAIFRFHDKQKTKHGDSVVHPEHQAVSLFHRENPAPEASYLPAQILSKRDLMSS